MSKTFEELEKEESEDKKTPEKTPDDDPLIDPELEEELGENFPEDPFLTEYASTGAGGGDSEKVDVTSDWIEGEDWRGKTKLSAEQIIAMTQVRLMPNVFDELEGITPHLQEVVESLERYAVSHQGLSREQHVSVLRALHSGEMHDDSGNRNAFLEAFAASTQEDDD